MNAPYPEYVRPLIGFLMWHMSRGETVDDALARAQAETRFAGIDPDSWELARAYAIRNMDMSNRLLNTTAGKWQRP